MESKFYLWRKTPCPDGRVNLRFLPLGEDIKGEIILDSVPEAEAEAWVVPFSKGMQGLTPNAVGVVEKDGERIQYPIFRLTLEQLPAQ